MQPLSIISGIILLAVGTYLMRFIGFRLGSQMPLSERTRALLADAAILLLLAVALSTTFYEVGNFAGFARMAGVAIALFLAWRKAPLMVIIISAGVVTAGLRFVGVM